MKFWSHMLLLIAVAINIMAFLKVEPEIFIPVAALAFIIALLFLWHAVLEIRRLK